MSKPDRDMSACICSRRGKGYGISGIRDGRATVRVPHHRCFDLLGLGDPTTAQDAVTAVDDRELTWGN